MGGTTVRTTLRTTALAVMALFAMVLFSTCELFSVGLGSKVDITAPEIGITNPRSASHVSGTLELTGTVLDDMGAESVRVIWTGNIQDATINGTTWAASIPVSKLADGEQEFTVQARDASGKQAEARITVYIDNKAPTVLVTAPVSPLESEAVFNTRIQFRGATYDPRPVDSVEVVLYRLEASELLEIARKAATNTANWVVTFERETDVAIVDWDPDTSNEPRTIFYAVEAVDRAGNRSSWFYHSGDLPAGSTTVEALGPKDQSTVPAELALVVPKRFDLSDRMAAFSIDFDTDRPVFTISVPSDDAVLGSGASAIGIVSDDKAIVRDSIRAEIFLEGDPAPRYELNGLVGASAPLGAQSYNFEIPLTLDGRRMGEADDVQPIPDGTYTIRFYAQDYDPQNPGTAPVERHSDVYSFVIDGAVPGIQSVVPEIGGYIGINTTIQVSAIVLDDNGVASVRVQVAGGDWEDATRSLDAADPDRWTAVFFVPDPGDPPVQQLDLIIEATDTTGKIARFRASYGIDTMPPEIEFLSPDLTQRLNGFVRLRAFVKDNNKVQSARIRVGKTGDWQDYASRELRLDTTAFENATMADIDDETGLWSVPFGIEAVDSAGIVALYEDAFLVDQEADKPSFKLYSLLDLSAASSGEASRNFFYSAPRFEGEVGDDDGIHLTEGLRYRLNGTGAWLAPSSQTGSSPRSQGFVIDLVGQAEGVYSIEFRIRDDEALKDGAVASELLVGPVWFILDQADPVITSTDPAKRSIKESTTISGSASDTNGIASVAAVFSLDGAAPQTAVVTLDGTGGWTVSHTVAGDGSGDGEYVYTITATDVVGRQMSLTRTLLVDTLPPMVEITSPGEAAVVSSTSLLFLGTSSDGSGSGVVKVEVSLDGTSWTDAEGTPASWRKTIELGGEGSKTLRARAVDALGQVSTSTVVNLSLDLTPPDLIETGIGATALRTNADFSLSGTASDTNGLQTWDHDADPMTPALPYLEISIDGGAAVRISIDSFGSWSYFYSVPGDGSKDGEHRFVLTATDAVGKTSTLTRTVTVDTGDPEFVEVDGVIAGRNLDTGEVNGWINFRFTATDEGVGLERSGTSYLSYFTVVERDALVDTSPAGIAGWTPTLSASSRFTLSFDTRTRDNGSYDLWVGIRDAVTGTPNVVALKTPIEINQESDRPILTFNNLDIGASLNSENGFGQDPVFFVTITDDDQVKVADLQYRIDANNDGDFEDFSGLITAGTTWEDERVWHIFEEKPSTNSSSLQAKINLAGFPQGAFRVQVRARDTTDLAVWETIYEDFDNHTWISSPAIPFTVDYGPPTIVVAQPSAGAYRTGFTLSGTASDALGVIRIRYSLDGGSSFVTIYEDLDLSSVEVAVPFNQAVDLAGYTTGEYILLVEATDFGNTTARQQIPITVDRTAPTVSVLQPTASSSLNGTGVVVRGEATDTRQMGAIFLWHGTASAADPADLPFLTDDPGVYDPGSYLQVGTGYNWNTTINTLLAGIPIADGGAGPEAYRIRVVAVDAVGNVSSPLDHTVTVSQAGDRPVIAFSNLSTSTTSRLALGNLSIIGTVTDDDSVDPDSIQIRIDRNGNGVFGDIADEGWIPVSDPPEDSGLIVSWVHAITDLFSEGLHHIQIRALDVNGTPGNYSTGYNWNQSVVVPFFIDNGPPALTLDTPALGQRFNVDEISVTGSTQDTNGIKRVVIWVNDNENTIQEPEELTVIGVSLDGLSGTALTTDNVPYAISQLVSSLSDGTKTIRVTSYDSSDAITVRELSVVIDTTPPSAAITALGSSSTVNGEVSVIGTATDNAQVSEVWYNVSLATDSAPAHPGDYTKLGTQTYAWNFNLDTAEMLDAVTRKYPDEDYVLRIVVVDGAGNRNANETGGQPDSVVKRNFAINQETDRPVIDVLTIDESKNAVQNLLPPSLTISGTVGDDDAVDKTSVEIRSRLISLGTWNPWAKVSTPPTEDSPLGVWSHSFASQSVSLMVDGQAYVIASLGDTVFADLDQGSSGPYEVGTRFVANGPGTGTGRVSFADGLYEFQIRAADITDSGTWDTGAFTWTDKITSGVTVYDTAAFAVDLGLPTGSITSPGAPGSFHRTNVTVGGTSTDPSGIKKITIAWDRGSVSGYRKQNGDVGEDELYFDNDPDDGYNLSQLWTTSYTVTGSNDGLVYFRVTITDAFDKTRTYESNFTVDTLAPGISFQLPVLDDVLNGSLLARGSTSDLNPVTRVWMKLTNGGVSGDWEPGTELIEGNGWFLLTGQTYNWERRIRSTDLYNDYADTVDKSAVLYIVAEDSAGNRSLGTRPFFINQSKDKPVVTITTPGGALLDNGGTITGTVKDDDSVNSASIQIRIGDGWTPAQSEDDWITMSVAQPGSVSSSGPEVNFIYSITGLLERETPYVVQVRAWDAGENFDGGDFSGSDDIPPVLSDTASISMRKDDSNPVLGITTLHNGLIGSATLQGVYLKDYLKLTGTAADGVKVASVQARLVGIDLDPDTDGIQDIFGIITVVDTDTDEDADTPYDTWSWEASELDLVGLDTADLELKVADVNGRTVTTTYTLLVDTTPPLAAIETPSLNPETDTDSYPAPVRGTYNGTIIFRGSSSDGIKVEQLYYRWGTSAAAQPDGMYTGWTPADSTYSWSTAGFDTTSILPRDENITYYLSIVAVDSAGNESTVSEAEGTVRSFIINQLSNRPILALDVPALNQVLETNAKLQGTSSDDDGLGEIMVRIDTDAAWSYVDGTDNGYVAIDSPNPASGKSRNLEHILSYLGDGSYRLQVRVRDNGHTSAAADLKTYHQTESAVIPFSLNTAAPTITIDSLIIQDRYGGNDRQIDEGPGTPVNGSYVNNDFTLVFTATDDNGLSPGQEVEVSLNNLDWTPANYVSGDGYELRLPITSFSDGTRLVYYRATDQFGKKTSGLLTLLIDKTEPSVSFMSPSGMSSNPLDNAPNVNGTAVTVFGSVRDANLVASVAVTGGSRWLSIPAASLSENDPVFDFTPVPGFAGFPEWVVNGATVRFINPGGTGVGVPGPFVAGQTYWLRDVDADSFSLAASDGGAAIMVLDPGSYEYLLIHRYDAQVELENTGDTTSWSITFDATVYDSGAYALETGAGTNVWRFPITVIARDIAGNRTVATGYVDLDPDGDKPIVSISTPAVNASVTGIIMLNGTVIDDDGTTGAVFITLNSNLGTEVFHGIPVVNNAWSHQINALGNLAGSVSFDVTPYDGNRESPLSADQMVGGTYYTIVSLGTSVFTAFGAASNDVGLTFRASGPGTGSGTVALSKSGDFIGRTIFVDSSLPQIVGYDGSAELGAPTPATGARQKGLVPIRALFKDDDTIPAGNLQVSLDGGSTYVPISTQPGPGPGGLALIQQLADLGGKKRYDVQFDVNSATYFSNNSGTGSMSVILQITDNTYKPAVVSLSYAVDNRAPEISWDPDNTLPPPQAGRYSLSGSGSTNNNKLIGTAVDGGAVQGIDWVDVFFVKNDKLLDPKTGSDAFGDVPLATEADQLYTMAGFGSLLVDVGADTITIDRSTWGQPNNALPVRFSGSDLPAGLDANVLYYIREVSGPNGETFKLHTSPVGGTAVDLLDAGSGTMHLVYALTGIPLTTDAYLAGGAGPKHAVRIDKRTELGANDGNANGDNDGFQESLQDAGGKDEWYVYLNTLPLPDGPLTVYTVAYDRNGNRTISRTEAQVTNKPPALPTVSVGGSSLSSGPYKFKAMKDTAVPFVLTATDVDASGVKTNGWSLEVLGEYGNATDVGALTNASSWSYSPDATPAGFSATFTLDLDIAAFQGGYWYLFRGTATDLDDNIAVRDFYVRTMTADTNPPVITMQGVEQTAVGLWPTKTPGVNLNHTPLSLDITAGNLTVGSSTISAQLPAWVGNNARVVFAGSTVPGGFEANTVYYIRDRAVNGSSFALAASVGGAAITVSDKSGAPYYLASGGHVENAIHSKFSQGAGDTAQDADVSGTLQFFGTVYDDTDIAGLSISLNGGAPYSVTLSNKQGDAVLGYTYNWTYTWDSSRLMEGANTIAAKEDVVISLVATATAGPSATKNDVTIDVVPYITSITDPTGLSNDVLRGATGRYSISSSANTLTVTGYNLGRPGFEPSSRNSREPEGWPTGTAGTATIAAAMDGSFPSNSISVSKNWTRSGYLTVVVNGTPSGNNLNTNPNAARTTNLNNDEWGSDPRTRQWNDDRYLWVWNTRQINITTSVGFTMGVLSYTNPDMIVSEEAATLDQPQFVWNDPNSGNTLYNTTDTSATRRYGFRVTRPAAMAMATVNTAPQRFILSGMDAIWAGAEQLEAGFFELSAFANQTVDGGDDNNSPSTDGDGVKWLTFQGTDYYQDNGANVLTYRVFDRIKRPKVLAETSTIGGSFGANVYVAYYDSSPYGGFQSLQFVSLRPTGKQAAGDYTGATRDWRRSPYVITIPGTSNGRSSDHYDMVKIGTDGIAVAYYDPTEGKLKMAYSTNAFTRTGLAASENLTNITATRREITSVTISNATRNNYLGKYFTIYNGEEAYDVWFNRGADSKPAGATSINAIEVVLPGGGLTNAVISQAMANAIKNSGYAFKDSVVANNATNLITANEFGDSIDVNPGNMLTATAVASNVSVQQQGASAWTTITVDESADVGQSVSMVYDAVSQMIYLAYYEFDEANLKLARVYWNGGNPQNQGNTFVDNYLSAGSLTNLALMTNESITQVASAQPVIAYYADSYNGTRRPIRFAFPKFNASTGALAAGTTSLGLDDEYSGNWEVITIPAISIPQGGSPTFNRVQLGMQSTNLPVVGWLGSQPEHGKLLPNN